MACAGLGISAAGLAGGQLCNENAIKLQSTRATRRTQLGGNCGRGFSVRASSDEASSSSSGPLASEDVRYLIKFGLWSVVGGAAIKYGSLVFPDVTVPDLSLALVLVASPVVASVFLLLLAGTKQRPS